MSISGKQRSSAHLGTFWAERTSKILIAVGSYYRENSEFKKVSDQQLGAPAWKRQISLMVTTV